MGYNMTSQAASVTRAERMFCLFEMKGVSTSQGANSLGERGKVTYVVVIAEGRAVGDSSRVTNCSQFLQCSVSEVRPSKYSKWWFCVPFVARLMLRYVRVTCDWPVYRR
jgi:hypothetical protein